MTVLLQIFHRSFPGTLTGWSKKKKKKLRHFANQILSHSPSSWFLKDSSVSNLTEFIGGSGKLVRINRCRDFHLRRGSGCRFFLTLFWIFWSGTELVRLPMTVERVKIWELKFGFSRTLHKKTPFPPSSTPPPPESQSSTSPLSLSSYPSLSTLT